MQSKLITDRAALFVGDAAHVGEILAPNSIDAIVTDPPAGISFMGREWDGDKGGRDAWIEWLAGVLREALRVLKPGGHALVWALPRTSHWTATAIEDAGFELRDIVTHLFGSGFPKSLDVSKALDAAAGVERDVVGYSDRGVGNSGASLHKHDGGGLAAHRDKSFAITTPATPAARQWDGWGTALKPAAEHWILARKPLDGTVAENVLAWGTGGINVDGCRVPTSDDRTRANSGRKGSGGVYGDSGLYTSESHPGGRWPANVTLDEHAAELLDAQAPTGASRFFYVAKPSRSERDAGCDELPARTGGEATGRVDGSAGLKSPRAGAGRGGGARNYHPTVKSVALMRWLCRLITPPGGAVLDLFAGSGTTAVAALAEGLEFVGVERDPDFAEIAHARIKHALESR
jgi:site-specific DNA-methyltransferase (adenine-specific)